jgi:hypothetical protein
MSKQIYIPESVQLYAEEIIDQQSLGSDLIKAICISLATR